MRSADQIVQYIEHFYSLAVERPESYFWSPVAMEAVLSELEVLYEFIVDDKRTFPLRFLNFGYNEFLMQEGYGASSFTHNRGEEPASFSAMAAFWRKYLESDMRKRPGGTQRHQE